MPNLYYRISDPSDLRDLGDQMAAWVAAGNPKANDWQLAPERQSEDATWGNGAWVVPSAPTFTAEGWLSAQGYGGSRPTSCLYWLLQLDAAGKSSPKLLAVKNWMDQILAIGAIDPDAQRSDWTPCPWTFAEVGQEVMQTLTKEEI